MAKQHQNIAAQMKTELEEPLAAFAGGMKERRKIVQNGIEKILKTKIQQTQHVNKVGPNDVSKSESAHESSGLSLDEPCTDQDNRRGIDSSRSASRSRATLPRATWLWAKRSERTRPS